MVISFIWFSFVHLCIICTFISTFFRYNFASFASISSSWDILHNTCFNSIIRFGFMVESSISLLPFRICFRRRRTIVLAMTSWFSCIHCVYASSLFFMFARLMKIGHYDALFLFSSSILTWKRFVFRLNVFHLFGNR